MKNSSEKVYYDKIKKNQQKLDILREELKKKDDEYKRLKEMKTIVIY